MSISHSSSGRSRQQPPPKTSGATEPAEQGRSGKPTAAAEANSSAVAPKDRPDGPKQSDVAGHETTYAGARRTSTTTTTTTPMPRAPSRSRSRGSLKDMKGRPAGAEAKDAMGGASAKDESGPAEKASGTSSGQAPKPQTEVGVGPLTPGDLDQVLRSVEVAFEPARHAAMTQEVNERALVNVVAGQLFFQQG